MIWIAIAILVVGYFVVRAINKNSETRELLEQQRHYDSKDYQDVAYVSDSYVSVLRESRAISEQMHYDFIELLSNDKMSDRQVAVQMSQVNEKSRKEEAALWQKQSKLQKDRGVEHINPSVLQEESSSINSSALEKYIKAYKARPVGRYDIQSKTYIHPKDHPVVPYDLVSKPKLRK